LVAAHPDDETLALGGHLATIRQLTLVHVTDGAPRSLADARRAGFDSREAYARARSRELERALAAAQVGTARRRALGIADQEAVEHLPELLDMVKEELCGAAAVITHPYEGGHPDHDACALIVQCACRLLRCADRAAPIRLEFPSYHGRNARWVRGHFWPAPGCPQTVLALDSVRLERKRAALAEFASQQQTLAPFPLSPERLRPAPTYDFTRAPPPGSVLYDSFGWPVTGHRWRQRSRALLDGIP
jgi:LmbE family N-acetylglucosaminyl deacetylase